MSERMSDEILLACIKNGFSTDKVALLVQAETLRDALIAERAEVERLKQPEYFWLESDPEWAADDIAELIYESGELSAGEECFVDICGARNTGTVRHKVTAKKGRFGLDYEIEAIKELGDE